MRRGQLARAVRRSVQAPREGFAAPCGRERRQSWPISLCVRVPRTVRAERVALLQLRTWRGGPRTARALWVWPTAQRLCRRAPRTVRGNIARRVFIGRLADYCPQSAKTGSRWSEGPT